MKTRKRQEIWLHVKHGRVIKSMICRRIGYPTMPIYCTLIAHAVQSIVYYPTPASMDVDIERCCSEFAHWRKNHECL